MPRIARQGRCAAPGPPRLAAQTAPRVLYKKTASQPGMPPELYYLSNFHKGLNWLVERYADLLDETERAFIERFTGLAQSSQALLVRMIMRKGPHFRNSRLEYPEIGCARDAAAPLLDAGWLDTR